MSHEIRTPINVIIGLNEMILRKSEDEEIKSYAGDSQLASNLLLGLVNDILDLSQMEMEKMKLVPTSYRTVELFGELSDLVRVRMERKGLNFFMDIDPTIPSGLYGDVKRIKQILLNLLDNASKYTESGSVLLLATGERYSEQEIKLEISVTDTGIGIRKEDMDHIYDAFDRFDEGKNTRILGSGLGLAITKQLVDLMDGEITVDSIYTKGSSFLVTVRQKIEEETPIGEVDFRKREQEGAFYKPYFEAPEARILIVDDNAMNAKVACSLLTDTKVQVDVANSGKECLERTKTHYYHVILLDYMMPGMDGLETLKAIRRQENGLCQSSAAIAMTANVMAGAKEKYQSQGFDSYLEKPIVGRVMEKEILKQLPREIVEYEESVEADNQTEQQMPRMSQKKRKKVIITADCLCDVPEEWLGKYDIRLLYSYIQTPNGRFMDVEEIDSDSLNRYMSADKSSAYADSVTVEECEEFFAEVLTQAERVIHITVASEVGTMYHRAITAAKSFERVTVINSGQLSGGEGLLVLHAVKLASEGVTAEEICAEIEHLKRTIQSKFLVPRAKVFHQTGYMNNFFANLCEIFQLRPLVVVKQNRVTPIALIGGNLESAWRTMIRLHLRDKKKIDKRIVFITHVNCSVKQLDFITREVKKCVPFEQVIVQKTSFTLACSSGLECIGIAYHSLDGK